MASRRSKLIIAALVGVFLVMAGGTTLAIMWLLRKGDAAVAEGRARMKARGLAYGKAHSRGECLAETFREVDDCSDVLMCEALGKTFLENCLATATRDDLCSAVPDGPGAVLWVLGECAKHGAADKQCAKMLQPVLKVCIDRRAR